MVLLKSGATDLTEYTAGNASFNRAKVIGHLGQPTSSETFSKPRTLGSLAKRYPTLNLPVRGNIEPPGKLVATVDTYRIDGYVLDPREYSAAGQSSIFTFGIGEAINIPRAASDRVSGLDDKHTFRIAYDPAGNMVARRLDSENVTVHKDGSHVSVW
ncbi:hypothetical protein [Luteolibacter sp. LG18]|uniref:hypothetical protein n=1 Tax=Luteolibacter sp. LG18 TaxID=2819286 RepID=UPI002B2CC0A4|nr:hypothetical protein llg_14210 [Luteolibacter sp. LG18]